MNSYFKEMIRLADSIADNAHLGQVDKNGWPYISHPRRVAFKVREIAPEELRTEAQIVGVIARYRRGYRSHSSLSCLVLFSPHC